MSVFAEWRFEGVIVEWRGPAPHQFVPVPDAIAAELRELAPLVTYGWGVIPVTVELGGSVFTTSLFPRHGGYLVPIKVAVRRVEGVGPGDPVTLVLSVSGA